MLNFRNARFIKSATKLDELPEKRLDEIVFIGKSNVGKSTLINTVCDNRKLCFTSSKPGHTKLLNYFEIHEQCYLVDAPGYGYSSAGKSRDLLFKTMMDEYFKNELIKCVVFLLDGRYPISEDDIEFYSYLKHFSLPFVIVITKLDKMNQSELAACKKRISDSIKEKVIFVSSIKKTGIEELKEYLSNLIETA